jgi:hypothetical protein
MERAVLRFVELLDGRGAADEARRNAALDRVNRVIKASRGADAALSAATALRLARHTLVRCRPGEDAAAALTARCHCVFDAASVVPSLVFHPDPAASAALKTLPVIRALVDAVVAEEAEAALQQVAARQPGQARDLGQVRVTVCSSLGLIVKVGGQAAMIGGRLPETWPELAMLREAVRRPGVATALLKAGVFWSEALVADHDLVRLVESDPLLVLGNGLQRIVPRRSYPHPLADADAQEWAAWQEDRHLWPQLLARSLKLRIKTRPSELRVLIAPLESMCGG